VNRLHATIAAAATLGLAGCAFSLFPKTPPAQLYTLHVNAPAPPAGAERSFNVERMPSDFAHEAQGDRILTVDGDQAAYIAAARWAAPASQLFDQAETVAFESASGPARLLRTGDASAAALSLRLDVQTFEARYLAGPKAAPTVVVSVHALLVAANTRKVVADQVFESQRAASDNRVSAIVTAFNDATTEVLAHIVDWTGREGATIAAS
jgi:cholesterol transport system auxiliary component